jgi:ABC-type lipoprotein export system ATPase subunit
VLADEPTGNLDDDTGAAIFELFAEINEQLGTSVVVVTHNSALARRMARRLVMREGLLLDSEARDAGAAE